MKKRGILRISVRFMVTGDTINSCNFALHQQLHFEGFSLGNWVGHGLVLTGFLSLYFCSRYNFPHPFLFSLAFTETSLNVAYAAHAALPAVSWRSDRRWTFLETMSPIRNLTLPETNSKRHLKMDGWKTNSFPFGTKRPIFRGLYPVRECTLLIN